MILEGVSFDRLVDNLHDGLYIVDKDRKIQYWNKAAEKISGFSASEVVGRSCSDNILTHVDSEGNSLCLGMCPLAMTIADGKDREAEVFLHHKDGHRVPVSVYTSVLTAGNGDVIGGVELFSDISSLKSIELRVRELEEMALLVEDLGNRLRMLVESSYITTEKERLHVSISIGATIVRDDDNADTLIKRADTLLYESKKAGRNRLTSG